MIVAIDIGGSHLRTAGSIDGEGIVREERTNTPEEFDAGIQTLAAQIERVGQKNISGLAIGIAGVLDAKKEKVVSSPNLPGWVNQPIKNRLEEIFRVPVCLGNDAAMGALGEATFGAGRKKQIVAFLTIGTGIGGARIVNGRIDENAMGFEPGHQIISVDGEVGYLEDFASGRALEKKWGVSAAKITDPQVWEMEARMLAIGIHNAMVFWSPEIVVTGGSVSLSVPWELVTKLVREQMKKFAKLPEIKMGELGDKCGLLGALKYFRQSMRE